MKTRTLSIILGTLITCSLINVLIWKDRITLIIMIFLSLLACLYHYFLQGVYVLVKETFNAISETIELSDINKTEKIILFSYLSRDPHLVKEKIEISLQEKEWESEESEHIAKTILKFVNLRIKSNV